MPRSFQYLHQDCLVIPNWFPAEIAGPHRWREAGMSIDISFNSRYAQGLMVIGGFLQIDSLGLDALKVAIRAMQSGSIPDPRTDGVLISQDTFLSDEQFGASAVKQKMTIKYVVREIRLPDPEGVTHYQSCLTLTDRAGMAIMSYSNALRIENGDIKQQYSLYGNAGSLTLDGRLQATDCNVYNITTWVTDETDRRWDRSRTFEGTSADADDPSPGDAVNQDFLGLYRDPQGKYRYSEHWAADRDMRPVTPPHQLAVPYQGTLLSDIFPTYLIVKKGFTTIDPIQITIDENAFNQGGHGTSNRWMIGLDPLLRNSWWGSPIYIEEPLVHEKPIPIYVRARSLGTIDTKFSAKYDTNMQDWNVHFMIDANIRRM